ncbi:MAG: hypothetical protein SOV74_06480 [Coriobacteriales bacterium]|nr:hypothetical protein [Coriobacteriales bacterium]
MVVMPTGDEPPKGYEGLARYNEVRAKNQGLTVNNAISSQLAQIEVTELKQFFTLHSKTGETYAGVNPKLRERIGFEFGLHFHPINRTSTDMMVVRAYDDGKLVGYAYVAYAWPDANTWTLDYLLVDPVGADGASSDDIAILIVHNIFAYMAHARLGDAHLVIIAGNDEADPFWVDNGFHDVTDKISRHIVKRAIRKAYASALPPEMVEPAE